MPLKRLLAKRTENMGASAIREILKVVSQPGPFSRYALLKGNRLSDCIACRLFNLAENQCLQGHTTLYQFVLEDLNYIFQLVFIVGQKNNLRLVLIEFKTGLTSLKIKPLPYLLHRLLDRIRDLLHIHSASQLPANLLGPVVNDEFSDVDLILYMMTGDGADYAQLKKAAEGMRQRLLKVPGVTKVDLYGTQDEKIFVEFSHAKLATLGITPQALFDSLAKQNNVVPAGTVETSSQRVPLRVTGALDGVKAVAETPVESNGRVFRLGDIATVTHGYVDPPSFVVRQEGKPAIGIGVVTANGANILELGKEVANATAEFMKAVPQGINVDQIADQPKVVEHAVSEFVHSFIEALAIVLFVSFVALGWRTGIVVALSVPLVLAIVFIVMNAMSLDLHRITLGALIIALGLLVDDAIIAVEMMVVKMEQGWDRVRAASFAWESTAFPMLTGTLVTAAGFLPIGFANSAVGEYAGGIFWIVAIALVASWFVAVIFTPYIGVKLLPNITVSHNHDPHAVYETRLYRILRSVIQWCVNHRIKVVLATVGIFALSIVGVRSRAAAVLPAVRAARTVPATATAGRHRVQRHPAIGEEGGKRCSRTTTTFRPTPPMSARARRASGSG